MSSFCEGNLIIEFCFALIIYMSHILVCYVICCINLERPYSEIIIHYTHSLLTLNVCDHIQTIIKSDILVTFKNNL